MCTYICTALYYISLLLQGNWKIFPEGVASLLVSKLTIWTVSLDVECGDSLGMKLDEGGFSRIAAQTAKQVIVQKVREAEREVEGSGGMVMGDERPPHY